jgi:NADH-quinone oxidoreductase subunit H
MELILYKAIIVVVSFLVMLTVGAYATLAERKFAGFFQDRYGPERAGPFGLLQPVADGLKFFFKENFIPAEADSFLFTLGPAIAMIVACMTSAVIPWGPAITIGEHTFAIQATDLDIGVLYISGVVSIGVYGLMIGGWASNNKYSLLGAIRASSQMISYEIGMGLALISIIMMTGSMSVMDIVKSQGGNLYGIVPIKGLDWNIFYQPIGFIIFCTCAFAECNRTPFDLPECEQELVGGYHTEYSSMGLGLYMFSEYFNMYVSGALMASLYFGGFNFPGMEFLEGSWLIYPACVLAILTKILLFIFFFMWVRWTIPRFRYDQLMNMGWKVMMPLAILNMLVTGVVILWKTGAL